MRWQEPAGGILLIGSLGGLFYAVMLLRGHDYVSAIVLTIIGLALLAASVELLRPSAGE